MPCFASLRPRTHPATDDHIRHPPIYSSIPPRTYFLLMLVIITGYLPRARLLLRIPPIFPVMPPRATSGKAPSGAASVSIPPRRDGKAQEQGVRRRMVVDDGWTMDDARGSRVEGRGSKLLRAKRDTRTHDRAESHHPTTADQKRNHQGNDIPKNPIMTQARENQPFHVLGARTAPTSPSPHLPNIGITAPPFLAGRMLALPPVLDRQAPLQHQPSVTSSAALLPVRGGWLVHLRASAVVLPHRCCTGHPAAPMDRIQPPVTARPATAIAGDDGEEGGAQEGREGDGKGKGTGNGEGARRRTSP
jgi:hypothetical protein